jgi:hypothetical protein
MANHAGAGVGGVAHVAVLDEDVLALAGVDGAWGEILRGGGDGDEEAEKDE